jgi:disulfide bond formation protein DsbB
MNAFTLLPRPAALFLALALAATTARAQILGDLEAFDAFGYAVAAGDFDGDGYEDLAVGAYTEDVGGAQFTGAVNVIYGSPTGLVVAGNQFWHQDSPGIVGDAEPSDVFGSSVAAGDFDGDGYDDLAMGIREEDISGFENAGALIVIYGSSVGLTADRDQLWNQGTPGVEGDIGPDEFFAGTLTTADFNGDGFADLAVGVRGEPVSGFAQAGGVNVLYGSVTGLTANNDQLWTQNSPNVQDAAESNDVFGSALAGGDFNGDGFDDLAVGAPGEAVEEAENGAINVLYGSATGLTATDNRLFRQGNNGVLDEPEPNDHYGWALASGDFDGDGFADLAVGVEGEDVGTLTDAGAVSVLYGTDRGLRTPGNQLWHQDSPSLLDEAEPGTRFGTTLASGDFDGDGFADLAAGAPSESLTRATLGAGAMNVLYGAASGLQALDNQFWHQNSPDVLDEAERFDYWSGALAAGDLDGDGRDDLAVGAPQEDIGSVLGAGAVNVLYGAGIGLSTAGNEFWYQGATSLLAGDAATSAVTEQPAALALDAPYPNPFNPSRSGAVMLSFALPEAGPARLAVYDVLGREVALLVDRVLEAGSYEAMLDARTLPAGTYLVRLEARGAVDTRALTLVR